MVGGVASACLFGVPGSQKNLGVGALRTAAAAGLLRAVPSLELTIFDDGWGARPGTVVVDGRPRAVHQQGARDSRRWHRPEAYQRMAVAVRTRGLGSSGARRLLSAGAVFDVSGGDSFSDIYGSHRFRTVSWPKRLALQAGVPLVLLPQTYGPFSTQDARTAAVAMVQGARLAWSRDATSHAVLRELLGAAYDPAWHRAGVDMAFALEREPLDDGVDRDTAEAWFAESDAPVAGVNVSGLLAHAGEGQDRLGVGREYLRAMRALCDRLLSQGAARLLLVPHVLGQPDDADSDLAVSTELGRELAEVHGLDRVLVSTARTAGQAKELIARCDWFTGARMHATIAALSTGVPTTGVAYSVKMQPVFETAAVPDCVVDARHVDGEALSDALWQGWLDRPPVRARLAVALPGVVTAAREQMREMAAIVFPTGGQIRA